MTGILHEMVGGHAATTFYHDLAGWVMMPLALVLYWIEIGVLSSILIETKHEAPQVLDLFGSRGGQRARLRLQPTVTNHRFSESRRSGQANRTSRHCHAVATHLPGADL